MSTRVVAVVEDARYREHRGPAGHPERPERLLAVGEEIDVRRTALTPLPARAADDGELRLVHDASHVALVAEAAARAPSRIDADTFACAASDEIARLAAGATIDLVSAVASGARAGGIRGAAATRASRGGGSADGLLPLQQRRDRRARRAARARRGQAADPRLGRPPRQRHAAQLRGRSVGALLLDPPVPVLPRHRCLARDRRRARRGRDGERAHARRVRRRRSTWRSSPACSSRSRAASRPS